MKPSKLPAPAKPTNRGAPTPQTSQLATDFQPKSTFWAPNVPPLGISSITLPGGANGPFYYSLGVESNIPFVSFLGGSTQKIISWGEMIEVPKGAQVTIKNESYMRGDISINSGWDYSAKPERISVPVEIDGPSADPADPNFMIISSRFPADTRRCRRAYLAFQAFSFGSTLNFNFIGKAKKHSFPATDSFTATQGQYLQGFALAPFSSGGLAPLGYGGITPNVELPMALTDQVSWTLRWNINVAQPAIVNTLFMYVLEY